MQAITPVDVHVENEWRDGYGGGSYVKKTGATANRGDRHAPRMRTCVTSKTQVNKTKAPLSSHVPQQVVLPKPVVPARSRSPSPNREPWVPPPGRSTKGQKFAWQSSKARLEINPVIEVIVNDDVDDESQSQDSERNKMNLVDRTTKSQTNTLSSEQHEKFMGEIQNYEKRIQGLIEGIGMLKERARNRANQEQTDQLRSEIDQSLIELERLQQNCAQRVSSQTTIAPTTTTTTSQSATSTLPSRVSRSRSPSPLRNNNYRSSSADDQRRQQQHRSTPKVSFEQDFIDERRRARSTTPTRGPLHLNPDRERLLVALSESEADIAQITKQLSSVKDILSKIKLDDQPVSFEIEQLYQQRNQLLHLIEQFENSNGKLKQFLRHQYHLEAEHGLTNERNDTLLTRIHELENENRQIRRLLLDRENENITLQSEFERIRTDAIGFDTMKTSLEHNRAHLQRELYAKEGEINRLQCCLRTLERDLQRNRYQCDNLQRTLKRKPMFPMGGGCGPSPPSVVVKTKGVTIEKLQAELSDRDRQIGALEQKLYGFANGSISGSETEHIIDAKTEITRLRTKLEHSERLVSEYREAALKNSVNNSKSHLSEIELDKMRARLQKRIEELEPLPELLRQAEMKNQELQSRILEQEKRLTEQAAYINELNSKTNTQNRLFDRLKENRFPLDEDHRSLQQKIDTLQRQLLAFEEENATLLRNLNTKEEALRNAQVRLNAKTHELTTISKQIDSTQTDLKTREDTFSSRERGLQQRVYDLDQQLSRLRLEFAQLKREKDESERRYTSQLGELRDKLEQSNNNNRSMQNYVNSLKTTYASVFNDTLPPMFSTTPFSRLTTTTTSVFP